MKSFNRIAASMALATLCTVATAAAPVALMAEGLQPMRIPSAATQKQVSPISDVLQAPTSNRTIAKELAVPDAINQGKAFKDSLTSSQQKQVKAVLGRFIPQLQEIGKQLKAPAQDGAKQPLTAEARQQIQGADRQLSTIHEQIASELSTVLSPEQLESFKASLKSLGDVNQVQQQTDSSVSTDYNYTYGYYAIYDLYYAYVYAYYSYLYEGYTTEAYYAYYYAYYAYVYAYYAYYYDTGYAYYAYYYAYYAYYYAYYNYVYYGGTYAYYAYYYAYYGYLDAYYAYYY